MTCCSTVRASSRARPTSTAAWLMPDLYFHSEASKPAINRVNEQLEACPHPHCSPGALSRFIACLRSGDRIRFGCSRPARLEKHATILELRQPARADDLFEGEVGLVRRSLRWHRREQCPDFAVYTGA